MAEIYKLNQIIGGDRKPPFGSILNRNHLYCQGLVSAYLFNEGGGINIYDAVTGLYGSQTTAANTPTWQNNNLNFDGSNDYIVGPGYTSSDRCPPITAIWAIKPKTAIAYNNSIFAGVIGELWWRFSFQGDNSGAAYCGVYSSWRFEPAQLPAGTVEVNKVNNFAYTNNHGPAIFYKNGKAIASGSHGDSYPYSGIFTFGYNTNYTINGELIYFYFYSRALSGMEIMSIHANPYQIFWHPMKDVYIIPAAAPPPTGGKSIFGYDSIFHAGGIIQT